MLAWLVVVLTELALFLCWRVEVVESLYCPNHHADQSKGILVVPAATLPGNEKHNSPQKYRIPTIPPDKTWNGFQRRDLVSVVLLGPSFSLLPMMISSKPSLAAEYYNNVDTTTNQEQSELLGTYTLKSGIIFRNVRIGKGPLVTAAPESTTNGSNGSDDKVKPTVVMHVQALLRDGTILMDTRDYGSPIVYELGSALKGMGNIAGVVTPGMDDVISSRGTLVGTKGDKVEPMRQGGIRRAVVPGDLGYGQAGLSQYQVWTLGKTPLRKPVPRNEVIRYEIEILRCMDVALQLPSPDNDNNNNKNKEPIITTAQACCPEDLFPCR